MPRTATVGPEIYKRVTELGREGKRRSEAFVIVGEERGSSPGTVSANYYRVARLENNAHAKGRTAARTRRRTSATTPRTRQTTSRAAVNGNGDIGQIAQEIAKLTEQLVRQIEERDEKLRSLIG
jgi:sirohydrochlorin ferrochelatase